MTHRVPELDKFLLLQNIFRNVEKKLRLRMKQFYLPVNHLSISEEEEVYETIYLRVNPLLS